MKTEIYGKVIGQVIRFLLRAAAVYLAFVDVTPSDQNMLVEVTVQIVMPVILAGFAEGWSWAVKRLDAEIKRRAVKAEAGTPIGVIETEAVQSSRFVSKY